jgi:hypothetical protein
MPSGPIPAFASLCSTLESKCRNRRTTSNFAAASYNLAVTGKAQRLRGRHNRIADDSPFHGARHERTVVQFYGSRRSDLAKLKSGA